MPDLVANPKDSFSRHVAHLFFSWLTDSPIGDIEYIGNGDMELDFTDNWLCITDCTLDYSNDSYTGSRSARVTNRYHKSFRDFKYINFYQNASLAFGLRRKLNFFALDFKGSTSCVHFLESI